MTPKTYSKQEHEENDAVSVALIQQDIAYMRADILEMKTAFREFREFYVTKEAAAYTTGKLEGRLHDLELSRDKDQEKVKFYVRAVIGNVITLILGVIFAAFKLFGGK
jgi:hypothetical protein